MATGWMSLPARHQLPWERTTELEQAVPSLLAVARLHFDPRIGMWLSQSPLCPDVNTMPCAVAACQTEKRALGPPSGTAPHPPALPAAQLNLKASSNRRTASQPQASQQQQQQGQGKQQQGPRSARIKAEQGTAR